MKFYSSKGIDNKSQIKHEENLQWRGVFWDFRVKSVAGYMLFLWGGGGNNLTYSNSVWLQ